MLHLALLQFPLLTPGQSVDRPSSKVKSSGPALVSADEAFISVSAIRNDQIGSTERVYAIGGAGSTSTTGSAIGSSTASASIERSTSSGSRERDSSTGSRCY